MALSGKKSKSTQQSGMNVYGQLAARALMAGIFGEDAFNNLGIGSFQTAGGGSIPESSHGDLSGIMPTQDDSIRRILEMKNELAGGYNDYNMGEYDAGFRHLPPAPSFMPPPGGGGAPQGKMPKKPAKGEML